MTKKYIPTQEMIEDYSRLNDIELSKKWEASRQLIIRLRKEYSLPRFLNPANFREHIFMNGLEYKWCGHNQHWELVSNFYASKSRLDGLRGECKECEKTDQYTEKYKNYKRMLVRRQTAIRKDAYIFWDSDCEKFIYKLFDGRCAYCGKSLKFEEVEFDHFLALSRGGKTSPINMLPFCVECNRGTNGKYGRDAWEWLNSKFGEEGAGIIYKNIHTKIKSIREHYKTQI